ncbi:MAG: type II secretion system protein GspJ [Pseudomonadota bacterium]
MRKSYNWLHLFHKDEYSPGFTMVEVLIAVTIVSVILTIIYGSFASSTALISVCRERSDIYQIARLSLERMAQDISCAFPPKSTGAPDIIFGFIGEDRESDGMPSDTLNFISTAHLTFGRDLRSPRLCEIGYYVETDPETDAPALLRREDATLDDEMNRGGIVLALAERLRGLDFKYYDDEGEEWDEWYSEDRNSLPRSVKITLTLEDENKRRLRFSTMVYLEMSGG